MLKRSIDRDQYDQTIADKIFGGAKRVCILFAVSALALSGLDLANIRTAESAAEFIHDSRTRLADFGIADLSNRIRSEIDRIALMPPLPTESATDSVTVAIPRGDIVAASRAVSIVAKSGGSPVAALADLGAQDAVELAMAMPDLLAKSSARIAVDSEPTAALRAPPMRLASVDPTALPDILAVPPAMPISLPSVIDVLPPPAPGVAPPSPAARLHLNEK